MSGDATTDIDRRSTDHRLDPFSSGRALADSVLYEGYVLYPYRRSSAKNRVRFQFGVLFPRTWVESRGPLVETVAGSAESFFQQTEIVAEAPTGSSLRIQVRFLQLQRRTVERDGPDGPVTLDRLEVGGALHLSFDEAVERSVEVVVDPETLLEGDRTISFQIPGGSDTEQISGGSDTEQISAQGVATSQSRSADDGAPIGRLVRRRWPLALTVVVSARPVVAPFTARRITIRTENETVGPSVDEPREDALRHSLLAAHTLVSIQGGQLLSLLDPPAWAAQATGGCRNLFTFPVLLGEPGDHSLVLSSPIILYDHPRLAPESPGDLHDATEIDEILSLRTLTLTDQEKAEARATDPRAAEIVDRVDSMPDEVLARLHGAIRSPQPAQAPSAPAPGRPEVPWWGPEADAAVDPTTDEALVGGVPVSKGALVRLRPHPGADAHDMFLVGRLARVQAVLVDVDDRRHLAVTLEDDPAVEIHSWYGRYYYFLPDEVEIEPGETKVEIKLGTDQVSP